MKKRYAAGVTFGVLVFLLCSCGGGDVATGSNAGSTPTPTLEAKEAQTSAPKATPAEDKDLTFGDTFVFDEIEITFGSEVGWSKVDNQFSDANGKDVIKVPIKLKNISSETHGLNMFYYSMFGSQGTELENVSAYFDDDVSSAGDLRSGAEKESFMYILYDGDGDYHVEFDNYSDKADVKLPIKK